MNTIASAVFWGTICNSPLKIPYESAILSQSTIYIIGDWRFTFTSLFCPLSSHSPVCHVCCIPGIIFFLLFLFYIAHHSFSFLLKMDICTQLVLSRYLFFNCENCFRTYYYQLRATVFVFSRVFLFAIFHTQFTYPHSKLMG